MSSQSLPTTDTKRSSHARNWLHFLRDIVVIIAIAILVSTLVKAFLVRSFYIPSGSMMNTLQINDRILVNELQPRFFPLEHGDAVVFTDPGGWLSPQPVEPVNPVEWALSLVGLAAPDSDEHLVKRIIGLPGDHVVCCNALGQITVNDIPLDEPYVLNPDDPGATTPFDVTVPANSLWVLGDNRANSADSRRHMESPGKGFVPIGNVVGRAFAITWPLDHAKLLD